MAFVERKPLFKRQRIKRKDSRGPGLKEASEMLKNYKELKETRRGGPLWPPIKGARREAPLRYLSGPWKRNLEPVNS
jgi:hypothetical protein